MDFSSFTMEELATMSRALYQLRRNDSATVMRLFVRVGAEIAARSKLDWSQPDSDQAQLQLVT